MSNTDAHPLDVDLVDFVDGSLDVAETRVIEEHLAACPSCRIKRQRISQTPPIELTDLHDIAVPPFEAVDVENADPSGAVAGELWLTAADDATMVLVTKVRPHGWGVVVVPVVFDIEVADNGTLILDETVSPLRLPISIYDGMLNSLPTAALKTRVVPSREGVDLLKVTDTDPGVSRGTPLEGPADPRHEIRQYINERVISVDPPQADSNEGLQTKRRIRVIEPMDQNVVDAQFRELQRALFDRPDTTVEPLSMHLPDFLPPSWEGIAQVRTFNQRVLLLVIEGGLPNDRGAARALCDRLSGSALAVCPHVGSPLADVYSRRELWPSHSVQSGESFVEPLFSGPVATAVTSYLDTMVNIASEIQPPATRSSAIDLKAIFREQVALAVDAQVATGKNAQIVPKRSGLMSVDGISTELHELLRLALSERLNPAVLIELSDRRDP